jgi:hypothetical protein
MWKITNKINRILYDNRYDMYIEQFNKFGDETKYYDYLFMYCKTQNIQDIMKIIFDDFHKGDDIKKEDKNNKNRYKDNYNDNNNNNDNKNQEENFFIFSTHLDKSEFAKFINKNKIPNYNDRYYTVVCKCILIDELVSKSTIDNSENLPNENENNNTNSNTFSENSFENLLEMAKNHNFSNKSILEISNVGKDKKNFIIKNRFLFIPEYLIEYNYIFNNKKIKKNFQNQNQNQNLNTEITMMQSPVKKNTVFTNINNNKSANSIKYNNNDILLSSYNFLREGKSTDFNSEFIKNFNSSLKFILNSEVKIFLNKKNFNKNSSCNFQFFDEIETTEIFFAKYSIFNYINHCYKFLNKEIFANELDKIKDNLTNIKKAPIKNPLIINNFPLQNSTRNLNSNLNSSNENDNNNNTEDNLKENIKINLKEKLKENLKPKETPKKNEKFDKLNNFKNQKSNKDNNDNNNNNIKLDITENKNINNFEQNETNSNIYNNYNFNNIY